MDRSLGEGLISENEYVFGFNGFEDGSDFIKIMKITEDRIKPNRTDWGGMEDMHGFFDRDGFHIEVEYNSMMGNFLVFKGDRTDANLKKVREWAKIIFDNLVLEKQG